MKNSLTKKLSISIVTGWLALIGGAAAQGAVPKHLTLDPDKPLIIGVGTRMATTLQFPSVITGLVGFGLTDGSAAGTYHFSHPNGSRVLSLRCLEPEKEAFVTVLLGDAMYALHLEASPEPAVIIRLTEKRAATEHAAAKPVSTAEIKEKRLDYSGERLLNLLKLSKNARVLKQSLPKLYEGVQHRKVALRHDDGNVSTLILEIYRFPKEDTLTFIAEIENRLDYAIAYDPGSMQLRVGKRVYPLNVVDASGFVPANSKARAHILLKGDTEGARAHLSIKNDFRLVMAEYSRFEQPPDLLTDYLEPLDEGLDPVVRPTPDGSPPSAGLLPPLNTENTLNTTERSTGK